MADAPKILGQSAPLAATQTTLYTVPAATSAVLSAIWVCNQNGTNVKVRIRVNVGGAADDPKQFLYYDFVVTANSTLQGVRGLALATGDVIKVQSDTTNTSFVATGVEIT